MSFLIKNRVRLFLFSLGVLGVIFAPPWVPLIAIGSSAFLYPAWEVLVIGLFADFVWLPADPISLPIFTILSLIMVWGLEPLRREFLK